MVIIGGRTLMVAAAAGAVATTLPARAPVVPQGATSSLNAVEIVEAAAEAEAEVGAEAEVAGVQTMAALAKAVGPAPEVVAGEHSGVAAVVEVAAVDAVALPAAADPQATALAQAGAPGATPRTMWAAEAARPNTGAAATTALAAATGAVTIERRRHQLPTAAIATAGVAVVVVHLLNSEAEVAQVLVGSLRQAGGAATAPPLPVAASPRQEAQARAQAGNAAPATAAVMAAGLDAVAVAAGSVIGGGMGKEAEVMVVVVTDGQTVSLGTMAATAATVVEAGSGVASRELAHPVCAVVAMVHAMQSAWECHQQQQRQQHQLLLLQRLALHPHLRVPRCKLHPLAHRTGAVTATMLRPQHVVRHGPLLLLAQLLVVVVVVATKSQHGMTLQHPRWPQMAVVA